MSLLASRRANNPAHNQECAALLSEARDRERALSLLQDKDRRTSGDAATLQAQLNALKGQLQATDAEYGQQRARAQAEVAALEARGRQDAAEVDALTRRVAHLEAQVAHLQGSEQQTAATLDDLQQRHHALVAAKAAADRHLTQAAAEKERADAALADVLQVRSPGKCVDLPRPCAFTHTPSPRTAPVRSGRARIAKPICSIRSTSCGARQLLRYAPDGRMCVFVINAHGDVSLCIA